jgi:hypothetical protein
MFQELARRHNFHLIPDYQPGQPLEAPPWKVLKALKHSPEVGSDRVVFLVCTSGKDSNVVDTVKCLHALRRGGQILIYADEAHDSGELAMDCVRAGAWDVIVEGRHSLSRMQEHLFHAVAGKRIYAKFLSRLAVTKVPTRSRGKIRGFIATPYDPPALNDYYEGIVPALDAIGIEPFLSKQEVTTQSVLEKVRRHIDDSSLVVVNLSKYNHEHHNPNVYFELGYALGRKPAVLILREGDSAVMPANLAGAQYVSYCCYADLAMQLQCGLK